jgi:16S rRNA (adenine1518-N6/adenine1519-N6)-dimethyltransferase
MSNFQTISYLTRRFREIGIEPATRHGQNFLVDINLQRLLVDAAQLEPNDVVLEVGTGTGALTAMLAEQAAEVITVEIDKNLFELASEELLGQNNVTLLRLDVLANKNRIDPRVLDSVANHLANDPSRPWKLVANLPFNIATPLLSNLLAGALIPTSMTVTIQKELADRFVAEPWTKDYSALSLWIQSQCTTQIVRTLPPSVFWPRPKVTSAIIHVRVDPLRRDQIPDLAYWHNFVRAMFFHRRKFLRSVMLAAFKRRLGKPEVDAILLSAGLGADARAEQLDLATMLALCEAVRAKAPDWHL